MKLQSKKRSFLASFLILFFIPSHSAEFEINFIETFDENYMLEVCLLYTSPSPRDVEESRMPSSA